MIIAAGYLTLISLGIATTAAIVFHEVPQETGDFGVLIYGGGVSRSRAIIYNFLTALTAFAGATFVVFIYNHIGEIIQVLLPLAAGKFIYALVNEIVGSEKATGQGRIEPCFSH